MSINTGPHLFIGIMSGTSADGIDVAIVSVGDHTKLIHFAEFPLSKSLRENILYLSSPQTSETSLMNEIDLMGETDRALGHAYGEAVLTTIQQTGVQSTQIAAIACHGQTIRHRPNTAPSFTLQIGCAATLAEATGITVVSDFRSRDIAAGGEGAPLVPFAHQQLFASNKHNTAIVNIGGVANVSCLGSNGDTTGFDIGPGNMLMDGLMMAMSKGRDSFDQNGELAASGQVCQSLLNSLMTHPFLARTSPKSTGREMFGTHVIEHIMNWPDISNAILSDSTLSAAVLSDADRLATACQFTVHAIANSIALMPHKPDTWLICGGGARNTHLMAQLQKKLAPANVQPTDAIGIPAQAVEAISFALLARHTLMGSPNTLSQVTGAKHDVCGGQISPGNNWSKLLHSIPSWIR